MRLGSLGRRRDTGGSNSTRSPSPQARTRLITAIGVVAALTWTVAPNASAASSQIERSSAGPHSDVSVVAAYWHCAYREWAWPGASWPAAEAQLCVGSNHLKHIGVADNKVDGRGLAIEIDPSGPASPLVYYDRDEYGDRSYSHDIGYRVRKWRFVSVQTATGHVDGVLPWQSYPLPYPDY